MKTAIKIRTAARWKGRYKLGTLADVLILKPLLIFNRLRILSMYRPAPCW